MSAPLMPLALRQREVRLLARACDKAGLVTAFGHCSVRLDKDRFLVCAAMPMGLIAAHDEGTVVPLHGPLPEGVLGEVRMHREVYRLRPDIDTIVRFISPSITALAAMGLTPRPRHGFGAYFSPEVPLWKDPALIRNDAAARGVAQALGNSPAVVVSVNGAVVGGAHPAQALALAIFLEDAARVELAVLHAGHADAPPMGREAAQARAVWDGRVAERIWDYWTAGDPEQAPA
jgi:HCOMODA/2-hydroxy-3-carboxy-muconic semialdehyde decarboxylase